MNKTEELNRLFERWKDARYKDTRFIKDGIINEEVWDKQNNLKILFLLKEINDKDRKWAPLLKNKYKDDMRDLINNEEPWKEIGYLAHGLQNVTKSEIPSSELALQQYKDSCKSSAIMNLKKLPGEAKADPKTLREFAKGDKNMDYIVEEIKIIDPQVIVLGGVYDILQEFWGEGEKQSDRVYYFSDFGETPVIDFAHPQARIDKEILYYALIAIYQKYLLSKRL